MRLGILIFLIIFYEQLTSYKYTADYQSMYTYNDYLIELERLDYLQKIEQARIDNIYYAVEKYYIDFKTASFIFDICIETNIDYKIFLSLIYEESKFNENALSVSGAVGYCQIKPVVVREIKNRYGFYFDRFDSKDNLLLGAYYYKALREDYRLCKYEALVFYNIGNRQDLRKHGERYAHRILKRSM